MRDGFSGVIEKLKETGGALASIAVSAGLVEKKSDFKQDGDIISTCPDIIWS